MHVRLTARGVRLTRELRDYVDRRLTRSLGRLGQRIGEVRVSLTDLHGPRGAEDVECRIQTKLKPRGTLVVHRVGVDPFVAVSCASERFHRRLARELDRFWGGRELRGRSIHLSNKSTL